MLIGTVEYNAKPSLLSFVEEINSQQNAAWGLAIIKRSCLTSMTNNEIVLALKPALQEVSKQKIFFVDQDSIYVAWFGLPRQTYQKIGAIVFQSLLKPEIKDMPEDIVTYIDPLAMGDELKIILKTDLENSGVSDLKNEPGDEHKEMLTRFWDDVKSESINFSITKQQTDLHRKIIEAKSPHRKLHILIIEDQDFLRNLLSDVLRTAYEIESASNLWEGWELYVETAPDIVFMDIQLPDGSGHTLAHRIKRLDPSAYVVMVTASNRLDDVEMAKYNHIDGFIVKPFSKKKISDSINHYMSSRKLPLKKEGATL